ncbi:MAG: thioredoxin-disulfide reductase [Alphaproteobacteria bacterium]|nr:thioredoxin-disulfide reductase [Alphaproteobacteria bacterium]
MNTAGTHAPGAENMIIIGAGPAGYAAAIYAARAAIKPLLVTGIQPGGQLTITTDVENYPGFAEVIQGPWLMEQMRDQALAMGTRIAQITITDADFIQRPFSLTNDDGKILKAKTVVIATGAQARWLGLESEQFYQGFGVSSCATCDGMFYRNKTVAVIGGGNTAMEEALYLTHHASEVLLVHRRDAFRGEKILQERVANNSKIRVLWDRTLDEVLGAGNPKGVNGMRLANVHTGDTQELAVDGVFIAIGHDPATKVFRGKVAMDDSGYILTESGTTTTNIPGIFAAGDVTDHVYRQAVTAAGQGCMAALDAERFLSTLDE